MAGEINVSREDLVGFFIRHLDKVYAAKAHLIKRLPEILYEVEFSDLEQAIFETVALVDGQRKRMEQVYEIMGVSIRKGSIKGLQGVIDETFEEIKAYQLNHELRDMSILFYMSNIESIEMASFQVMQMLAIKIGDEQIKTLLKESYQDSQADRTLMLLITTKYLKTV